jgi:pimeloyl-ACP methyl ester carboxylesterase
MISDPYQGHIDYEEQGSGPTVVLLPGSCSTGAVWRPVIAAWNGRFRSVTTSLLGYGGTAERRTRNALMRPETDVVETVIRRAGSRVHLVGHSFGGVVALAVALGGRVPLASLAILEAPVGDLLREAGERGFHDAFQRMKDGYSAAYERGEADAIGTMIDFYSGPGTFASWPERARAYAVQTTPVNILDWATAYASGLSLASLATIDLPALVLWGGASHPAMQRANELVGDRLKRATSAAIAGAAHFMLGTHPVEVARLIGRHVNAAEATASGDRPALAWA